MTDGEYEVELYFSAMGDNLSKTVYVVNDGDGKSKEAIQFNVVINGKMSLEDFCPLKQYGALKAIPKTFVVMLMTQKE